VDLVVVVMVRLILAELVHHQVGPQIQAVVEEAAGKQQPLDLVVQESLSFAGHNIRNI
jgi:hypothetical protein